MAADVTTKACKSYPSAAAGVSLTPSGTAFVSSAWVEIIPASTVANAIALAGIMPNPGVSAVDCEIDVGTGAAGSEVVIATYRFSARGTSAGVQGSIPLITARPLIDNIAANVRVAVRFRKGGTSVTAWLFTLLYYDVSVGVETTAAKPAAQPSAAGSASPASGSTAWTNGAYAQIVASLSGDSVVHSIAIHPTTDVANIEYEVDIATGAAGSEVAIATFRGSIRGATAQGLEGRHLLGQLFDGIANASRIAARLRSSNAASISANVSITVIPKPL